ncbi:MAG: carboxylesterase/lipase family protein [Dehalococcoidia bacterium]|jgi:para-nitrobenzyl esterase
MAVAAAFFAVIAVISTAGCHLPPSLEVIGIDSGKVRGALVNEVWTYFGIPYAAAPIGDLRWREPQPVVPWDGIRDVTKFGPACPQPKSVLYDVGQTSEDCLYLNIWSPAKTVKDDLPVMVWIHGGSFITGTGSSKMYDGMNLAKQNVIVVTINYRLGPFGFLSHPLLSKESQHGVSGNYGLLDQIAALNWVKKNIKAFGGKPDRITVWGESAGAASVCDLMVSPLAHGLFQRAIAESGSFSDAFPQNRDDMVDKAEKTGQQVAAALGCDKADNVLAAMRLKSADEVMAAAFTDYDPNQSVKFRPVVDGWVIPDNPWSLFTAGKQEKVPLLIGTNADEGTIFVIPDPKVAKMSEQDYRDYVTSVYGDHASDVIAAFPAVSKADVPIAMSKLRTVLAMSAGALHAADTTVINKSRVFQYQFTRIPDTPLKMFGAFHGLEIFYVFGNLKADKVSIPDDKIDTELSQAMTKYWCNFAKTGDPNDPKLPKWPAYSVDKRQYLELGDKITAKSDLYKEYFGLIDEIVTK